MTDAFRFMLHNNRSFDDFNLRHRYKDLRGAVKDLQESLEHDSKALKDLSTRFANPKLLETVYSHPELSYVNSCKDLWLVLLSNLEFSESEYSLSF